MSCLFYLCTSEIIIKFVFMSEEIMKVKDWVADSNKSDLENFNAFLIMVANTKRVSIRSKMVMIKRYMDGLNKKVNGTKND